MLAKFASLMEFFPGQHSMLLKHSSSESILISLCVNIMDRKGSPSNAMQSMKQRNRDRYQYVTLKPVHSTYEQYYIFLTKCHLIPYPHCTLWMSNEQDVGDNVQPPTRARHVSLIATPFLDRPRWPHRAQSARQPVALTRAATHALPLDARVHGGARRA